MFQHLLYHSNTSFYVANVLNSEPDLSWHVLAYTFTMSISALIRSIAWLTWCTLMIRSILRLYFLVFIVDVANGNHWDFRRNGQHGCWWWKVGSYTFWPLMFLCLCFMTTWNLDTILSPSFDDPSKLSLSGIILEVNIYVLRSIL